VRLLILTDAPEGAKSLLPALEFLEHEVAAASLRAEPAAVLHNADVVVVDATTDLAAASAACRAAAATEVYRPILVVADDGGLAALKAGWGFDDWTSPNAGPAELETRLRIVVERVRLSAGGRPASIGELHIDEHTYVVRLGGRPLDLTFREFELLKFLATNPGRVFSRSQLLQEVWGYDYFGGTRTVDVHIRRLRAKLGPEHEHLIGTVRGVGYKLDPSGGAQEL
jgi:DNA-binding response OmpR family regulator